jgi:PadR family transcriptional regulator PadR
MQIFVSTLFVLKTYINYEVVRMKILSRLEEIILLSVWRLGENAYGITIREEVVQAVGKNWPLGAIYAPLDRLRKNGFVRTVTSPPTPERGGRRKVLYHLTPSGTAALAEIRKINAHLWAGIPNLEFETQ